MKLLRWVVSLSRIFHWVLTGLVVLLVGLTITGLIVIRTQRFRDYVRRRIVEQVETTTNGRFEFGRFYFNWERLTAEMTQVVLHGKETEGPPLVTVDSVTIGLRIISLFERKIDLARVRLERPRVHIVFYPDGSMNIPDPHHKTTWTEDVLDLAVRDYEAVDGVVEYNETRIPLRVQGEGLRARMSYDPVRALYSGDLASERVQLAALSYGPIPASVSAAFTLEQTRLSFPRIRVSTRESRIDLAGAVDDIRAPHGAFTVRASTSGAEAVRIFKLPIEPAGTANFDGKAAIVFVPVFDLGLNGKLTARGAGFSRGRLRIANADLKGDLSLDLHRLSLANLEAHALGTRVTGQLGLSDWREVHFRGAVDGLGVQDAAALITPRAIPWTGTLAGSLAIDGALGDRAGWTLRTNVEVAEGASGVPVYGQIDASWDSGANLAKFGPSWLKTASTRVDFRGTPGQTLGVTLFLTNQDDLLAALGLFWNDAPKTLPFAWNDRLATIAAEGTFQGPLDHPEFEGRVSGFGISVAAHPNIGFSADVRASRERVEATRLSLVRGPTSIGGSATVTARGGAFDDALIAAELQFVNAGLADLEREATGSAAAPEDLSGTASGNVRLSGSVRRLEADGFAEVQRPAAFGEQADRLRVTFRYAPERIEVSSADLTMQNSSLHFSGTFRHGERDWKNGQADFDVSTSSLPTARIRHIARMEPPLEATLAGKLHAAANIVNGAPTLTAVDGTVSARGVSLYRQMVGEITAALQTRNAELSVRLNGKVRDATFEGSGAWRMEGDDPGSATVRVSRLSLATLSSLAMLGGTPAQQQSSLPFDGFIEGSAALSMPLLKPAQISADVTLAAVQFTQKPGQAKPSPAQAVAQDIVLRNNGPVALHVAADGIRIAPAQFTARDTSLAVSGVVPFGTNNADVALRGNINLAILQLLNSSLLAKGSAGVDVAVRGAWRNPAVSGRMQFNNASLYLADLPNGMDNVSGAIVFDRNRANIERLTAETGGGHVSFGGALEFSNALVYRLQADAQQVRVRWPEDVSTSFNAHLELNGTPDASTLSGTVTLNRTALNARADLGRLMAQAARPTPAPASPNEYLRGMQFDVRVESAPDFELDTALTHEVQTGVDLRLRGTPLQPVVLGSVSVNAGEVQLFGNRYSIDRGDIRFLNPVRIDPVLDMSLETKARGIAVNVSLSGTLQRLRVNYSSDPPLQPSEIIALLAVGRSPTQSVGITNPSAESNTGFTEAGGSLLGEAVSQQLSSRLQRFFGASRVKIDPTLTGVDNSPQARLTLEQQVSRDITVTYITNLNYTQEQTVRVQWDFDRQWSAVAVRDANGLFGIDVQYRRRF